MMLLMKVALAAFLIDLASCGGFGFIVSSLGFRVWGLVCGDEGVWFEIWGYGFRVSGFGFMVWASVFG